MTEPTRAYYDALAASQNLHAKTKKFNGRFFLRYFEDVERIIGELGCETLLDYGCGKGVQWDRPLSDGRFMADRLGVKVTKYDPAWPPYAAEPQGQFDIVVCTQVLGSIPVTDLPWVVDRLYGFASRAIYVGERIKPVRKDVHFHMRGQMPHNWTHDQWVGVLRRPEPPVRVWLRTRDSDTGINQLADLS